MFMTSESLARKKCFNRKKNWCKKALYAWNWITTIVEKIHLTFWETKACKNWWDQDKIYYAQRNKDHLNRKMVSILSMCKFFFFLNIYMQCTKINSRLIQKRKVSLRIKIKIKTIIQFRFYSVNLPLSGI